MSSDLMIKRHLREQAHGRGTAPARCAAAPRRWRDAGAPTVVGRRGQQRRDRRSRHRANRTAHADEAVQPLALLAAEGVGHEAPEHRHHEQVEHARPDEEHRCQPRLGVRPPGGAWIWSLEPQTSTWDATTQRFRIRFAMSGATIDAFKIMFRTTGGFPRSIVEIAITATPVVSGAESRLSPAAGAAA